MVERERTRWSEAAPSVPLLRHSLASLVRLSAARRWGFDAGELRRIQQYFRAAGREPTDVELAGLAQSWSEHCSYKSSKPVLRARFGRLPKSRRVLGTGDAGVLLYEPGQAYALRIESHNHPSAVEPYGGAATGIGGILRDVLAVGAKPIALADPIFFGAQDTPDDAVPPGVKSPRYLMGGVVAGIRDYGNRVGVPTVSGGVYFDPAYIVNPLVNVGCLGFLPAKRLRPNRAQAIGDRLVLAGGLTGRDGIGGVAFASQELDERSEEEMRGAVQLGNPITKEPLIRACIEAYDAGLVRGVKDLGGGGLATASGELVHAGGFGSRIELDRVPLRESGLKPWEIWISESQERMIFDVRPDLVPRLLAVFRKYDVPATDLGSVVSGRDETITFHGETVAHLRLSFRIDPPPARRRGRRRPSAGRATVPAPHDPPQAILEELLFAPESVSREPVIRVYDHEVQGRTVVKPLHGRVESPSHGDAAVIRPRIQSPRGLAVTVATQPWSCRIDPYAGAIATVEEAARNLYAVGARPDAFTDCLNFGNPTDPKVYGDFDAAVHGLADGARALGMAVPSGNVSFYNGGMGRGIPPTPVLMAVGIVDDVRHAVTSDLKRPDDALYLLGASSPELGGSLYARGRQVNSRAIPPVDPKALARRGSRLLRLIADGKIAAAHDVSDGGLAVALPEMAFGGGLGFEVDLDSLGLDSPGRALAVEGASRFVLEVPPEAESSVRRGFRDEPLVRLGTVTEGYLGFRSRDRTVASLAREHAYARWRVGMSSEGEPRP
ncbi:MAG TPA: phosphoribosylformylglycinamidine synthase subunit PurL [Thermoplasmata archaeon]|nr:phosphoribosylformylglycinamidine synthase subunit PurL [Thermoplasmata archaeon]